MSNTFEGENIEHQIAAEEMRMDRYEPNENELRNVEKLIDIAEKAEKQGIRFGIFGGYGLDILYGKLTRPHHDVDMLVSDNDAQKLDQVLNDNGFELVNTTEIKKQYAQPAQPGFIVEFAPTSVLKSLTQESEETFLPQSQNGSLLGRNLRAVSIEGQKILTEIQNKRAVNLGWEKYSPEKEINRLALLRRIEKHS